MYKKKLLKTFSRSPDFLANKYSYVVINTFKYGSFLVMFNIY